MARTSSLRDGFLVKSLSQQAKVLVSGDAGRLEVIPNDRNRHLIVSGDHDRPSNTRFVIRAVTTFLPNKLKAGQEKHFFEGFPVHWRDSGHD